MINGQDGTLTIAAKTTFIFPKEFAGSNNRSIGPDTDGNEWLETWSENMAFSESRSVSDNNNNLSSGDVVNTLVAGLQKKGYSE